MDSDIEVSDDETPCLDECQNEIERIESFYQCFIHRYNACPVFFMGPLIEACESAFDSSTVEERRPLLVYIHHDKSPLSNKFCSNIFCSEKIIEYLLKHYLVWPWDITYESNRNKLMKIWKQIFPIQLHSMYFVKRCPMLIGIMRRLEKENYWSVTTDCEFHTLLEGDDLIRIQEKLSRETLLKELTTFKKECDENEHALSFNFINKTGLCWDVILEIAEYLSLNDAVAAFSLEILPKLLKSKSKLHLSEPSNDFIRLILQKTNPERIFSLRLKAVRFWPMTDLTSLAIFTEVTSLTLLNLQRIEQLYEYEHYFSKLNYLCLWFDDEVNYDLLYSIVCHLKSIKRLKISSTTVFCNDACYSHFKMADTKNNTIKYFYFDTTQSILTAMNDCYPRKRSCFPSSLIDLIENMKNIQYVRLTIDKSNVKILLNIDKWKHLVGECHRLKNVTLNVLGSIFQDKELIEEALKIQRKLCEIRQTIKFQINFL